MRKYNFIFFTFLSRRLVTPQACKGGINILLAFLCVGGLFFAFSIAYAIEVGGHLTEDTIWGPENNPYLVTGGIYVDVGVTLTILPGTIVKLNAALFDAAGDDDFYFSGGEEPVAKFIRVDGRIIAEGTEQDSIIFTRLQDEQYFHWGTVYLPENAQPSRFSYCLFEFSAFTGFSLAEQPHGGISMWNGSAKIEKCAFIDNDTAIYIRNNVTDIQIIKNYFDYYEYPHPNIIHISGMDFIGIHYIFNTDIGSPLIAGNIFMHGTATYSSKSMYFVDNSIESVTFYRDAIYMSSTYGKSYFYNNEIGSCSTGINSFSTGTDSLYIKNNYFATNGGEGIEIDNAYVEVSDNYFEGCDLYTEYTTGKIWNNISNNGEIWTPGEIEVYNNICYNNVGYGLKVGYNPYCVNNISINNEYDIWSATVSYENCIIINNEELTQHVINGNPVFRNCIIDFELEYPLIDGGGNIIIDSLQAQQIFQDIQNGDFHLIEGSLAIDAGFDTLGYYYPFDMDYNHRVWDGDNNGSAIIDIGPYEFGSPAFGGIEGYTYNPSTGEPVDYVLININNEPGEFTFSDSLGNFQYKLPAGIYDVYAECVFYEDVIEYQVEVFDEQFTQVLIQMFETVEVTQNQVPNTQCQLTNYPNPFNPKTTISFSLAKDAKNAKLEIYNIKGQKVKQLVSDQLSAGQHSEVWDGDDESGKPVSSGVYLYKLNVNGKTEAVRKCLLLK